MIRYLTTVEVLAMHDDQINRYGGSHGVRDMGLLESALFRPRTGYYDGVIEEAAALWESFSQNHPFIDGNKRTAFATAATFLRLNGWAISSDGASTAIAISSLYELHQYEYNRLVEWLKSNTRQI